MPLNKETKPIKMTLKNQTGKRKAMMENMVSGSRNSLPFTTDEH